MGDDEDEDDDEDDVDACNIVLVLVSDCKNENGRLSIWNGRCVRVLVRFGLLILTSLTLLLLENEKAVMTLVS